MNRKIKFIDLGMMDFKEAWDYHEEEAAVVEEAQESRFVIQPSTIKFFKCYG